MFRHISYEKKKFIGLALAAALITFFAYIPSLQCGSVNWDDEMYVFKNAHIRSFDAGFLKWVFTNRIANNWHPLTIISYALDYRILGLNPLIYHLTSIIFHALNTFLVAVLFFKLINIAGTDDNHHDHDSKKESSLKASLITALLFGLHPLHVESVTWISERKDVLYAFFYLLSVLSYLEFVSASSKKSLYLYYASTLVFFSLSLMSKPMAVSLPFILLLLDYYPFGRWTGLNKGFRDLKWKEVLVILEKIPFFILSAIAGGLTVWAQGEAVIPLEKTPFFMRVVVAIRAYMFYLYKTILPVKLVPLYPYPTRVALLSYEYIGVCVLFLLFTVLSILVFRKYKLFLIAWLYYVITLLPVVGLIQVGDQAAADRYTYLASLGPFILISAGIVSTLEKIRGRKILTGLFSSVIVIIFFAISLLTVRQENIWKDGVALWSHEIELYPTTFRVYALRGIAYQNLNDFKRAIKDYDSAIALDPGYAGTYDDRGVSYGNLGYYAQAVKDFDKAIELNPRFGKAYNNRGYTFLKTGEYGKAVEDIKKALELDPLSAGTNYNLGSAYSMTGDKVKAEFYFKRASDLGIKLK